MCAFIRTNMISETKRKYKINDSMRAVTDVIENLVALEDHCFLRTDRCKRCLGKHMLKAQCGAKDAIEQDHKPRITPTLEALEKRVRGLWKNLDAYENDPTDNNARKMGLKVRRVRLWMQHTFDITHIMSHFCPVNKK